MRSVIRSGVFAACIFAGMATSAANADLTFHVAADTSSIANTAGVLDIQFNGAWSFTDSYTGITHNSPVGVATVSNFQYDPTTSFDAATEYQFGNIQGDPLSNPPMVMTEDIATNPSDDPTIFEVNGTFGQSLSFDVTFSGAMFDPVQTSGTNVYDGPNTFTFDFLDPNTGNTLETNSEYDTNSINIDAGGSVTATEGEPGVIITQSVPEPAAAVLLLVTCLLPLIRRRAHSIN